MAFCLKNIFTLACLFLCSLVRGQQGAPSFVRYAPFNGLPSVETYQLLQDSKGYIWVATDRGVARIDGNKEMLTLTTQNGLYDDAVYGMHEDKQGRLWFFSHSGQLCYWKENKIHRPLFNDTLKTLVGASIIKYLVSDNSGGLYAGSNRPPFLLRIGADGKAKVIKENAEGIHLYDMGHPFYYSHSQIPKGPDDKVSVTVFKNGRLSIIKYQLPRAYPVVGKITAIKSSGKGYYVTIGDYLLHIDTLHRIKHYMIGGGITVSLYEDREGNIWVGTAKKGVFCFPGGDLNQLPQQYLTKHSVSSVYQDYENGYWFTTLDAGVFYSPDIELLTFERQDASLSSVISTTWAGNELLVNTRASVLHRVKKETGMWQIEKSEQKKRAKAFSDWGNPFVFTLHKAFFIDPQLPTHIYYIRGKNYLYYKNDKQASIFADSSFFKQTEIKLNTRHFSAPGFPPWVWLNGITIFNNTTYAGTSNGIYYINPAGRAQYLNSKNKELKARINDLCTIKDSFLLGGTVGGGLIILDKNHNVRTVLKSPDGLPSNTCNVLFRENDSVVWVGTNAGLCRIAFDNIMNPVSFRTITIGDGLASNYIISMDISGDKIAVGTDQGFSILNNKPGRRAINPVQTTIRQILINNNTWAGKDFLQLSYRENNITISYTCNQYKKAGQHLYRYRLTGGASKWVYTYNTSVSLYSLAPGSYNFEVQVQNADASWQSVSDVVHLTITPPVWNTLTARVAMILFFLMAVSAGWIWYTSKERRKHQQQLALDYYKSLALKNQMNPHFIFNSLASIQNYILSNNLKDSARYLAKFAKLMRLTLDNSRKTMITLEEELSLLKIYIELEKNRSKEKFEYSIQVSPAINPVQWKLPPLLLQPYIENAILHGLIPKNEKGHLIISIDKKEKELVCTIHDDGIGRAEAGQTRLPGKKHQSGAMDITANRLRLMSKLYYAHIEVTIEDLHENGRACGTKVIIKIPVINFGKNDKVGNN